MPLALAANIRIILQACRRLLIRVHLLLELDSGLKVRMSLLRVLCEINHLAVVIRCNLMLRQVLCWGVLGLGRQVGYQCAIWVLVQVDAGMTIVWVAVEATAPHRRLCCWHVQRCSHFIAILTQVVCIVCTIVYQHSSNLILWILGVGGGLML